MTSSQAFWKIIVFSQEFVVSPGLLRSPMPTLGVLSSVRVQLPPRTSLPPLLKTVNASQAKMLTPCCIWTSTKRGSYQSGLLGFTHVTSKQKRDGNLHWATGGGGVAMIVVRAREVVVLVDVVGAVEVVVAVVVVFVVVVRSVVVVGSAVVVEDSAVVVDGSAVVVLGSDVADVGLAVVLGTAFLWGSGVELVCSAVVVRSTVAAIVVVGMLMIART
mmetsp:Transcript_68886/g.213066  ORF Transcript_68886/g.213066 Transcript_68886/m.213066 type:complete len:217 (-) Transcript_68886:592-1242(-)